MKKIILEKAIATSFTLIGGYAIGRKDYLVGAIMAFIGIIYIWRLNEKTN